MTYLQIKRNRTLFYIPQQRSDNKYFFEDGTGDDKPESL